MGTRANLRERRQRAQAAAGAHPLSRGRIARPMAILGLLMFSKYFYLASFSNFYTFYLMAKFNLGIRSAQLHLFLYLGAAAAGTVLGGPIGDRIGRKRVIWASILGVLPFSLALPYAGLAWTTALTVIIGLVLSSAFSAILVYAQELVPGNVGLISGLFFGLAFGLGGVGAALLGALADRTSIAYVYQAAPRTCPSWASSPLSCPRPGRARHLSNTRASGPPRSGSAAPGRSGAGSPGCPG